MQERSAPINFLFAETLRVLAHFLVLVALSGIACLILSLWLGIAKLMAVLVSVFFALVFFSAPVASSTFRSRHGIRLLSPAGGKTLLFSSAWGAAVVALFLATLQFWQGMEATFINYLVAMGGAGIACAATATIPTGR